MPQRSKGRILTVDELFSLKLLPPSAVLSVQQHEATVTITIVCASEERAGDCTHGLEQIVASGLLMRMVGNAIMTRHDEFQETTSERLIRVHKFLAPALGSMALALARGAFRRSAVRDWAMRAEVAATFLSNLAHRLEKR
jgi:hypothetical protein